jgi:catechol 2,3-dioxygenase-like lactoylglutathione lyase family enzyme
MIFDINRTNTILYCRNWDETVSFYQNVLQFPINHQTDWFVEFRIDGNTYLSVADEQRASIKSALGKGLTLSWQVADIRRAQDRLRAKKIDISQLEQKWGALVCFFRDPEGNRIELWETLEK